MPRKLIRSEAEQKPFSRTGWLELLLEFCAHLSIDSKESDVGPLKLYGSQMRFLAEIVEGLERDVHTFINLKAMQLGISTISLAIDLFWLAVHPGMQGVLVTDSDGNRQKFRIILKRFITSLPRSYHIQIAKGGDNREHMIFENGSVLDFLVAGTRSTATEIGRSRAYNFAHLTECANYGTLEGVVSLLDRLAEKHPHRLYLIESTARGFNLFYRLWQQAKSHPDTQKAFFIGWWSKEDYSIDEHSPLFKKYWDGELDYEEQERVNKVWEKYGVRITPQQMAWYRWKSEVSAEASLIDQNFPWDEEDAFLSTGQGFFSTKRCAALVNSLSDNPPPFQGFAYQFGETFMQTKVDQVHEVDAAMLKIYEPPSELGSYAMGIDPAYGRSENKDNSVIQVLRCYADRLVQVAEFATYAIENHQVAWVLAHLAGLYKNIMMIIEITGPGDATVREVDHLKQLFDANALPTPGNGDIKDLFGNARWYMYHRIDSPGPGFAWHWSTNESNKLSILTEMSDSFTTGLLEIRSIQCAMEMQSLVRRGFTIEPALDDQKDDRVFGIAFAHRAWSQWIRPKMISDGDTFVKEATREKVAQEGAQNTFVSHIISDFFSGKDEEREEEAERAAWK